MLNHHTQQKHYLQSLTEISDSSILSKYYNITDFFYTITEAFSNKIAFTNFGGNLKYSDLKKYSDRFSNYLLNDLKLKKGDRLAIMLPNCLQYPIVMFGAINAGLTVVNINPLYTAREFGHQILDSGATTLIISNECLKIISDIEVNNQIKNVIITSIDDLLQEKHSYKTIKPEIKMNNIVELSEILKYKNDEKIDINLDENTIAFIQYTGGTTGLAKGAMLTHKNIISNLIQINLWLNKYRSIEDEIILAPLPLYHIFALMIHCFVFLETGANNVIITNPKDSNFLIDLLSKTKFSTIVGVNTFFNNLLNNPEFKKIDFSNLQLTLGSGMAVQQVVADKWYNFTGCPITEGYGMTECSPGIMINPISQKLSFNGSIGLPLPLTQACIKDDNGKKLEINEVGEICIKGPQVMEGYWHKPIATKEVIDSDGWLHTGDLGRMDENGFFYIVDRKKDMIIVSGFNVYPNEIEEVLSSMPDILEVAAIGVPNSKTGEAVKVVIVKKNPELQEQDVKDFARCHLTAYKVPHIVEFLNELPKSNVGKILRRELR